MATKKQNVSQCNTKLSVRDAIALAMKREKKRSLSWYDRLDPKRREWCDELKREYQSGSCAHVSIQSLRLVVNETLSLSLNEQSFRVWLKDIRHTRKAKQ